jgi:uncharacterized protein (DUF2141 family)
VEVTGISDIKGSIVVNVYSNKEGFPTKPAKARYSKAEKVMSKTMEIVFDNIQDSTIAVSVFQDRNSNGKLDTNFIGMPNEPVGVSNNAKGTLGPPSFKDAKFKFISSKTISITIE